jgi:hypothetical protein
MEVNEQINELLDGMIPAAPAVEAAPIETPVETPIEASADIQVNEPEAPGESPPLSPADLSPPAVLATPAQEPPFIPPIEEPVIVVDEKEETIKSLRQQLEEMAARTLGVQPPAPAEPKPAEPVIPAAVVPIQAAPVSKDGFINFIESEEQFDEVMKTPEGFNKLLTGVVQRSVETVLRNVPQMVVKLADQQITTRSAINEFYMENKDLVSNKAYVGMVANEMAAKNPDWTLDKLLGELGKEVKTRLKMAIAAQPAAPGAPKPGFVPRGGGGKPPSGPTLTGQDKQIADLIS